MNENPNSPQWGYTLGGVTRVWRTGVGIDRRGNLIYVAADDQTVITLGQDPPARRRGAGDGVRHQPRMAHPDHLHPHAHGLDPDDGRGPTRCSRPTRYLVPDDRDFFAVYRPLPGPVTVPFN